MLNSRGWLYRMGALAAALILASCGGLPRRNDETPRRQLTVAAAADLQFALDEIVAEFRREHPDVDVKISYGSSGNFYSQLINRAPFDIYFSADLQYPNELKRQGLILEGSEFAYAVGRIVVWVPASSPLNLEHLKMDALRDPSLRHIAIANPRHAPYGRAAEAAMRSLGVYEAAQDKLIFGENIAQTFQFIQSGSAEIGIVALALVLTPNVSGQGRYWEVPLDSYPRMEQGGAILPWAQDPEAAWSLRSFVLGETGRGILHRFGFFLPEN